MDITGKIQALRLSKSWTISKLSRECGVPLITLRKMLNRDDQNNYTIKNLIKIADALGVTVSYLTLEQNEYEKPSLTTTQMEELKTQMNNTITNYFSLIKPNARSEREKAMKNLEGDLEEELED